MKTETLVVSENLSQCTLHDPKTLLRQVEKFKYLGVVFMSNGRPETELAIRSAGAYAVYTSSSVRSLEEERLVRKLNSASSIRLMRLYSPM